MNRLTVLLVYCLALGVSAAPGQEVFHAILNTGDYPLFVDSLGRQFETGTDTIATPGFGGPRETEDTLNLEIEELPLQFYVFFSIEGETQPTFVIESPEPDQQYDFPLDGPAWLMFVRFEPGVEELPGTGLCRLTAEPSVFGARTELGARFDRPGRAVVEIYDAAGRPVRRLADARLEPGVHRWTWDATDDSG
ncbi:hypothetical protein JXB37_07925, partial [candidate division WOR-3 bacterium]|nr:hypothetical protein [candidate division WOR-3 bacterium]